MSQSAGRWGAGPGYHLLQAGLFHPPSGWSCVTIACGEKQSRPFPHPTPKPFKQPGFSPFLGMGRGRDLRCPEWLLRQQLLMSDWPWNLSSLTPNFCAPSRSRSVPFCEPTTLLSLILDLSVSSPESSPLPTPSPDTPTSKPQRSLLGRNLVRQTRESRELVALGTTPPRKRHAGHAPNQ